METHHGIFEWVLKVLAKSDLLSGKTALVDATMLEANAALICTHEDAAIRTYISEPDRGVRNWKGKDRAQQAVYAYRRRIRGEHGKRLLRLRGELAGRSFAHCYENAVYVSMYQYDYNIVGNIFCRPGDSGGAIWQLGQDEHDEKKTRKDSKVEATLLRHGNFDFLSSNTLWDSTIKSRDLPSSLYLKEKPAWFGELRWPPFGCDQKPMVGQLPAKLRYINEVNTDEDRAVLEGKSEDP